MSNGASPFGSGDSLAPLGLEVRARAESLPAVRRAVTSWVEPLGLDEQDVGAMLVVVSELLANSVEACDPADQLSVRMAIAGPSVTIEVSNPSHRSTPVRIPPMADPLSPRGRGLNIVRSLVEDISLAEIDGCTVARARLRPASARDLMR